MADYGDYGAAFDREIARATLAEQGWAEANGYLTKDTYCLYCGCVVKLKEVHRTKCNKED